MSPTRTPRPCRRVGCPALVTCRDGWCHEHRQAEQARYNRDQRPKHHRLYSSTRWRRLRDLVLIDSPFCSDCGKLADLVHHDVEHGGDPDVFFDRAVLVPLCSTCHERRHTRGAVADAAGRGETSR